MNMNKKQKKTSLKENVAVGIVGSIMMGYSALATTIVLDAWTDGVVSQKISEKLDRYMQKRSAKKAEREMHDPRNIGKVSKRLMKKLEKCPAYTMEDLERECAHA